jgi:hypothetical protein
MRWQNSYRISLTRHLIRPDETGYTMPPARARACRTRHTACPGGNWSSTRLTTHAITIAGQLPIPLTDPTNQRLAASVTRPRPGAEALRNPLRASLRASAHLLPVLAITAATGSPNAGVADGVRQRKERSPGALLKVPGRGAQDTHKRPICAPKCLAREPHTTSTDSAIRLCSSGHRIAGVLTLRSRPIVPLCKRGGVHLLAAHDVHRGAHSLRAGMDGIPWAA